MEIIGVRYQKRGTIYSFSPKGLKFKKGEYVIVRSKQGKRLAQVVLPNYLVPNKKLNYRVKPIMARATKLDLEKVAKLHEKERSAIKLAKGVVRETKLAMKIVGAEYTLDRTKLVFNFIADKRIDFRQLVRDLARIFHIRIELRQIGVRDEAKNLGGISTCGREFCCATFLNNFAPVSIKMAKEQGLSLNPLKISGLCGRLLCCLQYESETYHKAHQKLPKKGISVQTPEGIGIITEINYLTEVLKVKLQDRETFVDYLFADVKVLSK